MKNREIIFVIILLTIIVSIQITLNNVNNDRASLCNEENVTDIKVTNFTETKGLSLNLYKKNNLFNTTYTREGENINVISSITFTKFLNCTLRVSGFDDLYITKCHFVNSRIHIVECNNITFSENMVVDYYVDEEPAILVQDVNSLNFSHNVVSNNSIGMVVNRGSGIDIGFNVFMECDQHNAIMGLNSKKANVHHNVFRFNFPHALMIMNREEDPEVQLDIYDNLFDRNIEDAINFEDFRGSKLTRVFNNVINGTGQAGINIEYNSWGANILIKENYIHENGLLNDTLLDSTGRPTKTYPLDLHQPEPYTEGWKHGIKLEDCSNVTVKGNTISRNLGCGVECTNSRNIILKNNKISENMNGVSLRGFDEGSFTRVYSPLDPSNAGVSIIYQTSNSVQDNINADWLIEKGCLAENIPHKLFTVSPIDIEFISSITPLGALNPPSHVFPTDHIYFMIKRIEGADHPIKVPVYSPGELVTSSIRVTEHVKAGIKDYVLFLKSPRYPEISIMFIHLSSLSSDLFGDIAEYTKWSFESEYETGGEIYRTWVKNIQVEVSAGEILGEAGGNPGQWALDLGVYDESHIAEKVANIDRWKSSSYLHSMCPLSYYEEGEIRETLTKLLEGNRKFDNHHGCTAVLQDIPGTAQGCWFKEGVIETYPEDLHLALVNSNVNRSIQVFSVGNSIKSLFSGKYQFTPILSGSINRDFMNVTSDGRIYGYIVEGFHGAIIITMPDTSTLWIEAVDSLIPEDWEFTDNKSVFVR